VKETVSSFLSKLETGIDNSNTKRKAIEILKRKWNKMPAGKKRFGASGGQRVRTMKQKV